MKQKIQIRSRKSAKHGTTYEYRFEIASIGEQRKWISKGGFADEDTARAEGQKAYDEYNTCGQIVAPTTMSFADFLEHWVVNDCCVNLTQTTIDHYRSNIKNLIVPYLGKYRINTIDRDKLQNLLVVLHDNGYSRNTLVSVKGILTKCFNYAYYSGYLTKMPAVNLKMPKTTNTTVPTRQAPHVYLTQQELSTIFDRFPVGSYSYLPLMIGLHCGLRIGETFALTWNDIDFDNKTISVNKQVQWRQSSRTPEQIQKDNGKSTNNSGCWYFCPTKYNSNRDIDMDDMLYKVLLCEKQQQDSARANLDSKYHKYYQTTQKEITNEKTRDEIFFVCVAQDGSFNPRRMQHTSRVIRCELGIEDYDYHSLRHTHATVLLENNAPLKYIQQRLGHKKIDITMNVYQHLTDKLRQKGTDTLNDIFSSES